MGDDEPDWSPLTSEETTSSPATDDAPTDDSPTGEDSVTDERRVAEESGAEQDSPRRDRSDVPEEYTTDERAISARIQVLWGLRWVVGIALLALIASAGLEAVGFTFDRRILVGASGAVTVLGLVWVHLRYRAWQYRLRDDALYLERGVLTHVRTVAPHVRIQHVDTSQSPGERALGLSTLVVYTAGSRGADVSIPGLTPGEAGDLQRRLKELAIESEGGDAL